MVVQRPLLVGAVFLVAAVGVLSMAVYFTLTAVGFWKYRAALREAALVRGRKVTCFLATNAVPSRKRRVATLLFVIRARSSRLDACRRFGQFVFSVITPYVFSVMGLMAVGLLAQGVGLVGGLYRLFDGVLDDQACRALCVGIGVAYFSFSAWGFVSCSTGLIRVRNLLKGKMNAAKRKRNKTVLLYILLGGAFLFSLRGCIPMLGWRIAIDHKDVDLISGYRRGECYALRQDVFLVKSGAYAMGMLGIAVPEKHKLQGSYYLVPQTVEDWRSLKDEKRFDCGAFCDIRGIMPKGTEIEIVGRKDVYAVSWWYGFEKVSYTMARGMVNGRTVEFEMSDLTDRRTGMPFEALISRCQSNHGEGIH